MKSVPGSVVLNKRQQKWYRKRFGVTYHAIAENPLRPNRATRRQLQFGGRRKGVEDQALFDFQRRALARLTAAQIRPL